MVIGTFREGSEHAGKHLTYEGGAYRIDDAAVITLGQLREHDLHGGIEWVDDEMRARHLEVAGQDDVPAPSSAEAPAGDGFRPSGEQIRIAIYIALGILAALAMFVFAPSNEEDARLTQEVGWVKLLSLGGSVSVTSEAFGLVGAEQRVNWTGARTDSGSTGRVAFRFVPAESADGSTAAIPAGGGDVESDSEPRDPTVLSLPPGSYRLEVDATNCEWTVSVWDKE